MKLFKRTYRPKVRQSDGTVTLGEPIEAKTWTVGFGVHGRYFEVPTGLRDRRAAEIRAGEIVKEIEREEAGDPDPFKQHRSTPLATHVSDFLGALEARGVVLRHLRDRDDCLRDFLAATGAKRLADLDPAAASAWIARVKERTVTRKGEDGQPMTAPLSARRVNAHVQAIKQLSRWLLTSRRIAHDPFVGVGFLNEQADPRHVRRALTPREMLRLIVAARRRPLEQARRERVRHGISPTERARLVALGESRALAYSMAAATGLRRGEILGLRWGDVDLAHLPQFDGNPVAELPSSPVVARGAVVCGSRKSM